MPGGHWDKMVWAGKMKAGNIRVADVYIALCGRDDNNMENLILIALWKNHIPIKILYFSCLVYHNKNLMWENLQKR